MRHSRDAGAVGRRLPEAEWGDYSLRLAVRLRQLRRDQGLSQEDVAYQAGMTRFTYQRLEKGSTRRGDPVNPSLRSLIALAQVLSVELSALLPDEMPDLRLR